jgi:hypothetical protein
MVTMPAYPNPLQDGRQSPAALEIGRGVARALKAHGFVAVSEVTLDNGRRADVAAVGEDGEIWIVEIKSSPEDYRADQKWPDYRDFCDRLFFAVGLAFPTQILPPDTGLIVADRYGGEIVRQVDAQRLAPARRKAMLLRTLRTAASRLQAALDPEGAL